MGNTLRTGLGRYNIASGRTDTGNPVELAATGEGHLEVAIHSPTLPFGEVEVESKYPEFQVDGVYGIPGAQMLSVTSGSGSTSGVNNLLTCSTGGTIYSSATLATRRRLRYRPGLGVITRFSGLFDTGIANCYLLAGVGTAEAGYYFGYVGTSFGILHVTGGVREIQALAVSTGATSATNVTVTLDGTAFTVPVTNSSSTRKTAYEIATYTGYTGWTAEQRGSSVIFVAADAGNKSGTFSYGAGTSGSAASFNETLAGVSSTDTFIPQSSWNGDKLDGTGPSGATLNPQYGNVYAINVQYLGYGAVVFQVEIAAHFVTVHTIRFPNTQTAVNITQPAFPFSLVAASAGSTTNKSVYCSSAAGFRTGAVPRYTGGRSVVYRDTSGFVGSTAATYYPLFSVRNSLVYQGRVNQSVEHILSIVGTHDDATPVAYYILRNATLVGTPNFLQYSTNSTLYWDQAATTCTITNNEQILGVYYAGSQGTLSFLIEDDMTIQPGETVTLACRAVTGTATYVSGALNIREDT